jgi:hypothetical protein
VAQLASQVADLQDSLAEMTSIVGKISNTQYQNQNNIITLQSGLERVDQKTKIATKEIEKFKTAIITMESKLATLSTTEDSNKRFDKIEALLVDNPGRKRRASSRGMRKELTQTPDEDMKQQDEYDNIFQENSPHMEVEDTITTTTITIFQAGDSDQTNSSQVNTKDNMLLK